MTRPCPFIWYDLVTTDVDAATRFYAAVAGLSYSKGGAPDKPYHHAYADGVGVGGCVALMPETLARGAKPLWTGYIYVADVDAAITAMVADGASVMMPRFDVPGEGAIALLADPWGAPIHVMTPDGTGESQAFQPQPAPGHMGWNELATPEPEAAIAFYGKHFGWAFPEPIDMGPMGKYHFLSFSADGVAPAGAIYRQPPDMPRSLWTYYIWADDIDAAMTRTTENGGTIVHGPHQVPGGQFIFLGIDPQAAHFAMVGPRAGAPA